MNLVGVLQKVTDVVDLGLHLGVPKQELDQIRQDFHTKDEQKRNMLQWWLKNDLAEWEQVISALRAMKEPVLADAVAVVCKCESLCESPTKESPRWAKMIKLLDEKLKEVQHRSQCLGRVWETGEEEWHKFLKEMKTIEEAWRDLVKSQQTERAFLSLGISFLCHSDLELLHRTDALKEKAELLIATSRKLRELYRRTTQHQSGLQNTETELEEWEKALLEHVSEVQRHIYQLKEKFLGETKDCIKQLEKSQEQLQTCRMKIIECRDELTKSQRQLQRCQEKLVECGEYFKRCRDDLSNCHSQITHCIEGLKKQSEGLPTQIEALKVVAGIGIGGVGVGAAVGAIVGPIGMALGAMIGGAIIGVGLEGTAQGERVKLAEAEKRLRECEERLIDCGNLVERCSRVLRKSEEELHELHKIMIELDQTLYH